VWFRPPVPETAPAADDEAKAPDQASAQPAARTPSQRQTPTPAEPRTRTPAEPQARTPAQQPAGTTDVPAPTKARE